MSMPMFACRLSFCMACSTALFFSSRCSNLLIFFSAIIVCFMISREILAILGSSVACNFSCLMMWAYSLSSFDILAFAGRGSFRKWPVESEAPSSISFLKTFLNFIRGPGWICTLSIYVDYLATLFDSLFVLIRLLASSLSVKSKTVSPVKVFSNPRTEACSG